MEETEEGRDTVSYEGASVGNKVGSHLKGKVFKGSRSATNDLFNLKK